MNDILEFKEYFGSPIYTAEVPEFLLPLDEGTNIFIKTAKEKNKKIIKQREIKLKKKIGDFGLSYHSNSLINISIFKEFQKYIQDRSIEVLDHMGYDLRNYVLNLKELWVQQFAEKGGGHHNKHVHYNSHVSGFYFLKCSDKTSFPIFNDPRLNKIINQLPLKKEFDVTTGTKSIAFNIKPGTLIMFPSFLEHEFYFDYGIDTFKFIHFNIEAVKKNEF
jgi:uncharacterized protein (TIGR02466 family)